MFDARCSLAGVCVESGNGHRTTANDCRSKRLSTVICHLSTNSYLRSMGEYSLGDAMKKFLRGSRLKSDIQAMQIVDLWEKLMGKTIARYTDSIKIYGDKLYISTKVAPLREELRFQKENIILRVNEALKENVIREVIIN